MTLPEIATRDEWLVARKALLAQEKEFTSRGDALNATRRQLPMVRIEKDYEFQGPNGKASLLDLFDGRAQLALQHFMFDPSWDAGCPSCSGAIDEMADGVFAHLHSRNTSYAAVSRAPIEKLEAYKATRGWTIPWYSSFGSDFNYDFHVTVDESIAPLLHNYRDRDELIAAGMEWITESENQPSEQPGMSFFLRDGDDVFHTYSTFGRGAEVTLPTYIWLDFTALGRQEEWEEPKGRVDSPLPSIPVFEN